MISDRPRTRIAHSHAMVNEMGLPLGVAGIMFNSGAIAGLVFPDFRAKACSGLI